VLRDLLDFARAEQEPTSASGEASASVREVVEEVAALVGPQKSMRDVELEIAIADDLPSVRLAPGRLQQVLLNLVLNAADAIDTKGGHIEIRAEHAPDRRYVRILVRDDGPGVAQKIRGALFEPFVTTKEIGKGTGLGLAVCRGLVEGAGGTIRLAEEAPEGSPKGACFVLDIPTPSAPPPARSVAPPPMR
jgi:signal transduction histidine kinase